MSTIIHDAKQQELKISFTFEHQEDKLIIKATADHTSYQLELIFNPDLDFEDLKEILQAKQFKLVAKTHETIKIKVGATNFEFKSLEKKQIDQLKQAIIEVGDKLKQQQQKNANLEITVNKLRVDFDLMTTKITDLHILCKERGEKINQLENSHADLRQLFDLRGEQVSKLEKRVSALEREKAESTEIIKSMSKDLKQDRESQERLIPQQKKQQKLKQENKILNSHPLPILKSLWNFSPQNKPDTIQLSNNNSTTTRPGENDDWIEFALVDGVVSRKGSSIRFKIQQRKAGVYVGLCIRNLVAANSYQFKNHDKIGHGYFILSWSGRSYSHSNKVHNHVDTGFKFFKEDVVKVQTDVDGLMLMNETEKWKLKLPMKMTEDEWKQACFCVGLTENGDSVSIQND